MERDIVWSSTMVNFRTFLFNIFICDMFYFLEDFDIANYADDSTPYCAGKSAEFVVNNLEQSSTILFEWLNGNTGKNHLLLSGNSRTTTAIDNSYTESEDEQVLLGITNDSNLTFENHINSICQKESKSKIKCPWKNRSLDEHIETKNNHGVFCNFSI